jgi:DNA repair protein SbcD/Mre11
MKLLHTSDWHLGRSLHGQKRQREFEQFLEWLLKTVIDENIEALLVAGDVFDTGTPPVWAQECYYQFLHDVSATTCRHVVIIAGNHDSPSFLEAPKHLLKALNVYVVGSVTENLDDEILCLRDGNQSVELIIGAVPYLRDRDVRLGEAGESIDDKNERRIAGIEDHYHSVITIAKKKQKQDAAPFVLMGHLFAAGGQTIEGDGVRDLYVGSLAHVKGGLFVNAADYTALGHLHVAQKVAKSDTTRYCGSPIPMGFGEASQSKKVMIIAFNNGHANVSEKFIPCFQELCRLSGTATEIIDEIDLMVKNNSTAWIEITYTGSDISGELRTQINARLVGSQLKVLRIKNDRVKAKALSPQDAQEQLQNLSADDVFSRCLDDYDVPKEQRKLFKIGFAEIVEQVNEV